MNRIQRRYQRISEIGCVCCRQYGLYENELIERAEARVVGRVAT